MAAQKQTQMIAASSLSIHAKHDFATLIGYTVPPADGSEPSMDDLASEHPVYRDIRQAKIDDVRGNEDRFTLDKHGSQYYKLPSIPGDGSYERERSKDSGRLLPWHVSMVG